MEISRFKLPPKKSNPQKIYTSRNDANINFLAEQLRTIRDFKLVSREQIYAKAEELQADADMKTTKLKELSDKMLILKSEIERLRRLILVEVKSQRLDAPNQIKPVAREIANKHRV